MGVVAVDARYGRVILEGTYMANTPSVVKRFGDLKGENIMAVQTDCIKQFIDDLLQIVDPKVIITDTKNWYGKVIDDINKYRGKNHKIKHFFYTLHVLWEINRYFKGYKKLKLAPKFENMKQDLHKVFEADTLEKAKWIGPKDMYKFINYPACFTTNEPKNFEEVYNLSLNTIYQRIESGISII